MPNVITPVITGFTTPLQRGLEDLFSPKKRQLFIARSTIIVKQYQNVICGCGALLNPAVSWLTSSTEYAYPYSNVCISYIIYQVTRTKKSYKDPHFFVVKNFVPQTFVESRQRMQAWAKKWSQRRLNVNGLV